MAGNLEEWALRHRVLVIYAMAVLVLLGALSYVRIGRSEDPAFTIKTMVVQAAWPGASLEETMQQVTDRLERTIQQVPNLDFIRSFTRPGVSTIFVNLREDTPAIRVPDLWYEVRKKVLGQPVQPAAGRHRPDLRRRFRRDLRHRLRLHGRRFHPPRAA